MKTKRLYGLILLGGLLAQAGWADQAFEVELEGGSLWVGRADVRIPGKGGTRFSLTDDLDADRAGYVRGRLAWRPADRHTVLLTLAPLKAEASGTFSRETRFADTVFPADARAKTSYQFNNYRVTYRYQVWASEATSLEFGGTLFVRDARITVETDDLRDSDSDLGLAPLISFRLAHRFRPGLSAVIDGDGLFAPQGRAIDVLTALYADMNDDVSVGIGYRILEGGADNDDVYTFALFHHAAVLLSWKF